MNRLHNLPALAFTFLALILLSACFGGGSQSCDAEFCGTSTPRTAAAPVTTPDTPDTGNGGMTPDPMMPPQPIAIPIPAIDFMAGAFDSTNTASGGVGRIVNTQVDSKDAILLIITDANIGALLQDPLTAHLLDNTGVPFTYADMSSIQTTSQGTVVNARADNTLRSGLVYVRPLIGGTSTGGTSFYIDEHSPVVLAYESAGNNLQVTTIGEPLSRLPSTTDVFSGTYSGAAGASRIVLAPSLAHGYAPFKMVVGFANGESSITSFEANFGDRHGSVSASSIPINNTNGTFTSTGGGTVNFTAGNDPDTGIINSTANAGSGTLLGQFHGLDASGVTGAFHNSANTVLGGFAGSKE